MIHVEAQGARIPALGLGTWQLSGDIRRPKPLEVHEQEGEVARDVGTANGSAELDAVEDLHRAVLL